MIDQTAGIRYCCHCGTGLPGPAAYCSSCGRQTTSGEAVRPALDRAQATVQGSPQYAPIWRRAVALALDVVLVIAAYYFLCLFTGFMWGSTTGVAPSEEEAETAVEWIMAALLVACAIYAWFGTASGGTLGQRVMGLRVLNKKTMQSPGIGRALVRVLLSVSISTMFWFLGYLWALGDREKQTWHDKAAGTIVVSGTTLTPRQAAISPAQYA